MFKRTRFHYFFNDVITYTPLLKMVFVLVVMWGGFSYLIYYFEKDAAGSHITTLASALYWGVAAFSTAGIADTPRTNIAMLLGGIWIVAGSAIFFGTIVATITTYFMRPMQRPVRQIVDTIEYNLERLDELSIDELEVLKKTVDGLILSMEKIQKAQTSVGD